MRAWCLGLVPMFGCAQLLGIDETAARDPGSDARAIDARRDAPIADARACIEGDANQVDPMTGACYSLFLTPVTRDEARAICNAIGGGGTTLASMQSAAENTLITSLVGDAIAFLGGNDEVTEGMFKWEDGSAVVLTNWNTGEPNNGGGLVEEDCIVILGTMGGKWDDRPCNVGGGVASAYAFVCERD